MNFSSPTPAINHPPRSNRGMCEPSSSSGRIGRSRRRSASRIIADAVKNRGSLLKKAASDGDIIDDLDKSHKGRPRVLSDSVFVDMLASSSSSSVKNVDQERSLKSISEDKAPERPRLADLRSRLRRDEMNDSQGTALTASTCTLDSSLSRGSALLSISDMISSGELDLLEVVKSPPKRSAAVVTFGTVEIREYPRALGDNPAVTSGAPLTIVWDHDPQALVKLKVDAYENGKPFRRSKAQMLIPHFTREGWLRAAGYSRGEIAEAVKEVDAVKESRRKSMRGANARRFGALKDLLRLGMKRT